MDTDMKEIVPVLAGSVPLSTWPWAPGAEAERTMSGVNQEIHDTTRCGWRLIPYEWCGVRIEAIRRRSK